MAVQITVAVAGANQTQEISIQKILRKVGGVFVYGRICKSEEATHLILYEHGIQSTSHNAAVEFNVPIVKESWLSQISRDFDENPFLLTQERISDLTLIHTSTNNNDLQTPALLHPVVNNILMPESKIFQTPQSLTPLATSRGLQGDEDVKQHASPTEAAERILAGFGTLTDVLALDTDDTILATDHFSTILKILRSLNAYHSVLTVRTEAVLGSHPTSKTRRYNSWVNSVMSRLQHGCTLPEILAYIASHITLSLENIEYDFQDAPSTTSTTPTTPTQLNVNFAVSPTPMQVDDASDILSPPSRTPEVIPTHKEKHFITTNLTGAGST
ncbi:hypothetical protein HDU99_002842, partial [Rhizoclosmatium hyalinum]